MFVLGVFGTLLVGCSGGDASTTGDNPASANTTVVPADPNGSKENAMSPNTLPPGQGRTGGGGGTSDTGATKR